MSLSNVDGRRVVRTPATRGTPTARATSPLPAGRVGRPTAPRQRASPCAAAVLAARALISWSRSVLQSGLDCCWLRTTMVPSMSVCRPCSNASSVVVPPSSRIAASRGPTCLRPVARSVWRVGGTGFRWARRGRRPAAQPHRRSHLLQRQEGRRQDLHGGYERTQTSTVQCGLSTDAARPEG